MIQRRNIRKASNVLRPSVKPFFSPKAASSKPWSAKPFIGTVYSLLGHCDQVLEITRILYEKERKFNRQLECLRKSENFCKMPTVPYASKA